VRPEDAKYIEFEYNEFALKWPSTIYIRYAANVIQYCESWLKSPTVSIRYLDTLPVWYVYGRLAGKYEGESLSFWVKKKE